MTVKLNYSFFHGDMEKAIVFKGLGYISYCNQTCKCCKIERRFQVLLKPLEVKILMKFPQKYVNSNCTIEMKI